MLGPVMAMLLSGCAATGAVDARTLAAHAPLDVLAQRHRVCGVAVAVIRQRKLDAIETASACPPASRANSDSVFQAASLSKPVFAYAVMKLVAQGKLALDAPVVSYLPQGYRHRFHPLKAEPSALVTDPRLRAVTVRMALNHTSGLPNWASGPLVFKTFPGATWNYSGEGYMLLQRAVEAVMNAPLDQVMASQVFAPLAMHDSSYVWNERVAGRLLPGTRANGAPRTSLDLRHPAAAFSLYTTASDYGKFLVALLEDGDMLAQITAAPAAVDAGLGLSWGLGWGIERRGDGAYIWQWGNNSGYRAFAIVSVGTGDGLVMLTNSENGLALAEPLTQTILPGAHPLFRSAQLGGDTITWICNTLRVCL